MEDIVMVDKAEADARLHAMAMGVVRLCMLGVLMLGGFTAAAIATCPGMFDEPRSASASAVLASVGAVGVLGCCILILIGVVVTREALVRPWIERGGVMS